MQLVFYAQMSGAFFLWSLHTYLILVNSRLYHSFVSITISLELNYFTRDSELGDIFHFRIRVFLEEK